MPPDPRQLLRKNVTRLRAAAELTQEELAEAAQIDRRYVQRIEAGTANPGLLVLDRLRTALDCSWKELLE